MGESGADRQVVVSDAREGRIATLGVLPAPESLNVCRRLRVDHRPAPILMLTARPELSDRIIGLDAGADDCLVKPFSLDELLARLRARCSAARARGVLIDRRRARAQGDPSCPIARQTRSCDQVGGGFVAPPEKPPGGPPKPPPKSRPQEPSLSGSVAVTVFAVTVPTLSVEP